MTKIFYSRMYNSFYFSIKVSKEQIRYANELVEFSLKNHPISNIWDKEKKDDTKKMRITGTTGEVIFADTYKLKRPVRSFGAIDGQDFGKDFELSYHNKKYIFDVKTMHRKSNVFFKKYVLNIPARNIHRNDSITDYYFCISLHEEAKTMFASFLGYVLKKDISKGKIGILYKKGTTRIRADKTSFTFYEDTYEVCFKDIKTPLISPRIKSFEGFNKLILR
ncbi:MAG: hypothetical protein L3J35_05760 [Bacteroidales bacterium]|nr:hypothetical protein [Bacteroidales bacterium]